MKNSKLTKLDNQIINWLSNQVKFYQLFNN